MILDQILDLMTNENPPRKLREYVAHCVNIQYEQGDFTSAMPFAGILFFRSPGYRVTSSTEDLVKCLVPEWLQFPPYGERKKEIKTVGDYLRTIWTPIKPA